MLGAATSPPQLSTTQEAFVFSQHCKAGRDVGLSEEQIQAIPAWPVATCFSPLERAVLAYTDCLVLEGGRVPEAVFQALRRELDDAAILELTYITLSATRTEVAAVPRGVPPRRPICEPVASGLFGNPDS